MSIIETHTTYAGSTEGCKQSLAMTGSYHPRTWEDNPALKLNGSQVSQAF